MRRERWCRKHCGHPMRRSWHRHQDRWQRAVGASACLNGELVGAGGLVERVGLLACQASRHEPAERVAHSDPPHPAGGLAQRCKAETASAAGSQHRGRRALLGQGRAGLQQRVLPRAGQSSARRGSHALAGAAPRVRLSPTRTRKRSRRGTSDYSRKSSKLGFVVLRRLASVHLQVDGIELCPCGCRDAGRGCSRVLRVGGGGGSAQGWRRPFRCFIFGRGQREARAVHASAGGG